MSQPSTFHPRRRGRACLLVVVLLGGAARPSPADEPLPAPAYVAAYPQCGSILVQWAPVSGATSYEVVASTGDTVRTPDVALTHALANDACVTYAVRAVDSSGAPGFETTSSEACAPAAAPIGVVPGPSQYLTPGREFRITLTGQFDPRSSHFYWRRNGVGHVASQDSPTFVIPQVFDDDTGEYTCYVTTVCGETLSQACSLTVIVPREPTVVTATKMCRAVRIDWQPVPGVDGYRVYKTDDVLYQAEISGPGVLRDTTWLDSTTKDLQAQYYVASVILDTLTGTWGYPVVGRPELHEPRVLQSPQSVSVPEGTQVMLVGHREPADAVLYWRKNGVPLVNGPPEAGYYFPAVTAADSGSYDFIVHNACGADTSAAAHVRVCVEPSVRHPRLLFRTTTSVASVSLLSVVTQADSVRWIRHGEPLFDDARHTGAGTSVLTILSPVPADAGLYELRVYGNCDTIQSDGVAVSVVDCGEPPLFQVQPASTEAPLGGSAEFAVAPQPSSCTLPTYRWQRYLDKRWQDMPHRTQPTLTINVVTLSDQGFYRCVMTRGESRISNVASLNVTLPQVLAFEVRPATCTAAEVSWKTSLPTRAFVRYGSSCTSLSSQTALGPLATSGSAVVTLGIGGSAAVRMEGTTANNLPVASRCETAVTLEATPSLTVLASTTPYLVQVIPLGNCVIIRLSVKNSGCAATTGSLVVSGLKLNGVSPRRLDGTAETTRVIRSAALGIGTTMTTSDFIFRRADLGSLTSGSSVTLAGTLTMTGTTVRTTLFSARVTIP